MNSSVTPPGTPRTTRAKVEAYLVARRQAGFALKIEAQQLASFVRFADAAGHQGPLTLDLATRWATATSTGHARTAARRIEVLRGLARYCQQFDPDTEIPYRLIFGSAHRRLTPHIYTDQEITSLLQAAAQVAPSGGLRAACYVALFGLLAATGLRISEALGCTRADVDLARGLLHVRQAKFGKARWVPLHATTTSALQQYVHRRDQDPLSTTTAAFFVGDYGRPALRQNVEYTFRQLRAQLGWRTRGGHPAPRIHDLRHTFICRRIERWYAEGRTIDHDILALSTYIGHVNVTSTYWYLTATPELLAIAASTMEQLTEESVSRPVAGGAP